MYQTFAAFQAQVAPREANSVTELPPFTDMNNNDLHIQPALETNCESGGQTVSTPVNITDDFDGDARYPNAGYPVNALDPANAPDIGADEFAGGKFHAPPVISYTPITNPVTNNAQTLVAGDRMRVLRERAVRGRGMPLVPQRLRHRARAGARGRPRTGAAP